MIKKTKKPNGNVEVAFSLETEKPAAKVFLVGDFNQWNATATPMHRQGQSNPWSVTLELQPERRYAFRYLADGNIWLSDDTADAQIPNSFGGSNSVLNLESSAMPVSVKHPYADTPYDVLSDPELGSISPTSTLREIRNQKARMISQQKIDPQVAAEMTDRLAGMKRLEVDVFLCCSFDMKQDLNQAIENHRSPRIPQTGWDQHVGEIPYWREISLPPVILDELTITHSDAYDDPSLDLQAVDFDL